VNVRLGHMMRLSEGFYGQLRAHAKLQTRTQGHQYASIYSVPFPHQFNNIAKVCLCPYSLTL